MALIDHGCKAAGLELAWNLTLCCHNCILPVTSASYPLWVPLCHGYGCAPQLPPCLQDNFFGKADALIGVCKDTENSCSATLTFDLNRFASDA